MKVAASYAVAALLLILPQPALADSLADGRTGRIKFSSVTPSGPTELVRRSYPATGTSITGTLSLPPVVSGRMPAMVISHGSGGILPGREDAWAARLNALGIATFVVDSFTPRGL